MFNWKCLAIDYYSVIFIIYLLLLLIQLFSTRSERVSGCFLMHLASRIEIIVIIEIKLSSFSFLA